jgi:predicted nucleotidyltransferase
MELKTKRFGLTDEVIERLTKIFQSTDVLDEVIIFGSRAKGNYKAGSDIDLAVKGKNVSIETILKLLGQIESLGLLYKIDLKNYNSITDPGVLDHITRMGKIFWKRENQ